MKLLCSLVGTLLMIIGVSNITLWNIWNQHHAPALGIAVLLIGILLYFVDFFTRLEELI